MFTLMRDRLNICVFGNYTPNYILSDIWTLKPNVCGEDLFEKLTDNLMGMSFIQPEPCQH